MHLTYDIRLTGMRGIQIEIISSIYGINDGYKRAIICYLGNMLGVNVCCD